MQAVETISKDEKKAESQKQTQAKTSVLNIPTWSGSGKEETLN